MASSEMQVMSPQNLSKMIAGLLAEFEQDWLKFIVDTHNKHFLYDRRPPLELWPIAQYQILKREGIRTTDPDKAYAMWLSRNDDSDEADRYRVMEPFRQFVMKNYKIVQQGFRPHILFQLKGD